MLENVPENFCGVLKITDSKEFDCQFSVVGNIVTVVPLSGEARKKIHVLSYNDGSNDKDNWLYGFSDANSAVAILQRVAMRERISSGIDLCAGLFYSPLIVHGSSSSIIDVSKFNVIEFYGGIMDILHNPNCAIDFDRNLRAIKYNSKEIYTEKFNVTIDRTSFNVIWSINAPFQMTSYVPDLKNTIHSFLRFEFSSPQPLDTIQKYYGYAMQLFQFCSGRLNVRTDIRLYIQDNSDPVYVKLKDSYSDYANEELNFMNVIRLSFLRHNFVKLFCLLNDDKKQPYLNFLPFANKNAGLISYTNVNDLCVAFEREYDKCGGKASAAIKAAAAALTDKLLSEIEKDNAPDDVKKKARDILNTQLKAFSPSLKEKIIYFYEQYADAMKGITQQENHDTWGITKFFNDEEFKNKISDFVKIRNSASHYGIKWNGGQEIFYHLNMLIYYSVFERAGFSLQETSNILSFLFGHYF